MDLELVKDECEAAVETGTHGPDMTFGRVVPISKVVAKILLAIALKVTEQTVRDRWQVAAIYG